MSFHRSERLVTAFLCISGAAESCVLPFLCLHLTQLGVPPLQAGLALSALLLLRGVGGALWWRSLRADRRPARRLAAAVTGAVLSAAVLCALAALPPSAVCRGGGNPGGGLLASHVLPASGHGSQTGGVAVTAPSAGGQPEKGSSGSQRPSMAAGDAGGEGASQPSPVSPVGSGLSSPSGETSVNHRLPIEETTLNQGQPTVETTVTSETTVNLRPPTSETNTNHRPAISVSHRPTTSEPGAHHRTSETSVNLRPATDETSVSHRPETSETSIKIRPTTSETSVNLRPLHIEPSINHRLPGSETTLPIPPEQSAASEQLHRSTFNEPTKLHPVVGNNSHEPPTTTVVSDHLPAPPTFQRPLPGPAEPTPPTALSESEPVGIEASRTSGAPPSSPPRALPNALAGPLTGQQSVPSGESDMASTDQWPTGPMEEGQVGQQPADSQGTQPADSQGTQPADSQGTQRVDSQETQPADSQGTQSADSQGTQPVDSQGTQPADSQGTQPADSQGTQPGGSQSSSLPSGSPAELGDSQTAVSDSQTSGFVNSQATDSETARGSKLSTSVVRPTLQIPVPTGPQTLENVGKPTSHNSHQTEDMLDSYLGSSDETKVRRTTRSPLPLELEGDDEESEDSAKFESSDLESESGRPESDSSYVDSESMDTGGAEMVDTDEPREIEDRHVSPDPTLGRTDGEPIPGSSPDLGEDQERTGETDQRPSVSLPLSDASGSRLVENKEGNQGHQLHHQHHHHRHHTSEHREDDESTGRKPSLADVRPSYNQVASQEDVEAPHGHVKPSHGDVEPFYEDANLSRQRGPTGATHLLTDSYSISSERRPSEEHPSREPPPEKDGNKPCLDPSQIEVPWDPRKHPDGWVICGPSPPLRNAQRQPSVSSIHSRGQPRRHSVYRHHAPPAPPSSAVDVSDLSEPSPGRGQAGLASGRAPGRGRLRTAGWRRVPVSFGNDHSPDAPDSSLYHPDSSRDQTDSNPDYSESSPDHRDSSSNGFDSGHGDPDSLQSDGLPTGRKSPSGEDLKPGGWRRNYNLPGRPTVGADLTDAILRPQDTLPLFVTPVWRVEQKQNVRGTQNKDRGRSQVRGRGGRSRERGLGHLEHLLVDDAEEIRASPEKEASVTGTVGSVWSGNEAGHDVHQMLRAHPKRRGDSQAQWDESRPAIRPEPDDDSVSRDRYEVSAGRSEVKSDDRRSEASYTAEPESRDAPMIVDPSGWSQPGRIYTDNIQPEPGSSSYETSRDIAEGEETREALPASSRIEHHRRVPSSRMVLDRPALPASHRRSGGRSRNYNPLPLPTDGGPTVDPTRGLSLADALHRLEDLSPALSRLLSGRKWRRETHRRALRGKRAGWGHRRQKRNVGDVLVEQTGLHEAQIDEAMVVRDRLSRKNEIEMNGAKVDGMDSVLSQPLYEVEKPLGSLQSNTLSRTVYITSNSSEVPKGRLDRSSRSLPVPLSFPPSPPAAALDPYLLFLTTLGLLSLWGSAGAPHRLLILHCWRRALDEAEHLERAERPQPASEATSAALLALTAGLWPLLPGCLPGGRHPLAVLIALGAALTLLGVCLLPWLPLVGGKQPPPRTAAVVRSLVSCRSSLLFTCAVFVTGLLTSAEFHFLFPLTATWRPPPQAALVLAAAAALASRLPVRALYRPLMVRCGFVGSVALSFTALSVRCLCYVCLPSAWALVPAQLLSGLTETLFWRAAHVFVDKTAHDGYQQSTLSTLQALYCAGQCCGVLLAGAAFSVLGGQATFAGLATAGSTAALGYYVAVRFSGDTPDLTYSKLPCDDHSETAALTGHWSRDLNDPDEVTDAAPTSAADQDWLERAMRKEGLL